MFSILQATTPDVMSQRYCIINCSICQPFTVLHILSHAFWIEKRTCHLPVLDEPVLSGLNWFTVYLDDAVTHSDIWLGLLQLIRVLFDCLTSVSLTLNLSCKVRTCQSCSDIFLTVRKTEVSSSHYKERPHHGSLNTNGKKRKSLSCSCSLESHEEPKGQAQTVRPLLESFWLNLFLLVLPVLDPLILKLPCYNWAGMETSKFIATHRNSVTNLYKKLN